MAATHEHTKAETKFPDHYTSEDRMNVRSIDTLAKAAGLSQGQLAGLINASKGTVNGILCGNYPSKPTKWLEQMRTAIERYMGADLDLGEHDQLPAGEEAVTGEYVETSLHRLILSACYRARKYGGFGVVAASVGTGKTTTLKRIAEQPDVYLIHGLPGMTHSVLLDEIVRQVGCPVKSSSSRSGGTKTEKLRSIIDALKDQKALLMLDEAENCSASTLEYLRRIRDLAGAGVVLCGNERLMAMVRDKRGRFGQISSRILYWPPIVHRCTRDDIEALCKAYMPDVQLNIDLMDAFEQACDGSARVLCEGVIPGVVDYGTGKGRELTPQLVLKISRDLLGFTPARRA